MTKSTQKVNTGYIKLLICIAAVLFFMPLFSSPALSAVGASPAAGQSNTATEEYPFTFEVLSYDGTTATLTCSVLDNSQFELSIGKGDSGDYDDYQIVTDNSPFLVDLDAEYSVCFKTVDDGTIYYYGGYITVIEDNNEAIIQQEGFFADTLPEYEYIPEPIEEAPPPLGAVPSQAVISYPQASGTTYTVNNAYTYTFYANGATQFHIAGKIISGDPDPNNNNELGWSQFEDLNFSDTGKNFRTPNDNTKAGLWFKLYVRGRNNDGYGLPAIKYVQIKPLTPTLNNPTQLNGTVTLSWNATAGAARYYVYRSTSSNGTYTPLGYVIGTSCIDTPGTGTFYYKVAAVAKTTSSTDTRILSKGVVGDLSGYKSITISKHTITKTPPTNGSFSVPSTGFAGDTITISSITPNSGYIIGTVTVKRDDTGGSLPDAFTSLSLSWAESVPTTIYAFIAW